MRGTEHRIAWVGVVLGLCTAVSCGSATADGWRVTLRGGPVDLGETPIVTEVNDEFSRESTSSNLPRAVKACRPRSSRMGPDGCWRLFCRGFPRRRPTVYSLERRRIQDSGYSRGIWLRPRGESLSVLLNQDIVAGYRVDTGPKPIIHPLVGPTHLPYTRAYPMQILPEKTMTIHTSGRAGSLTARSTTSTSGSDGGKSGKIKQTDLSILVEGLVLATMATKNDWLGPDGSVVCRDDRTVRLSHQRHSRHRFRHHPQGLRRSADIRRHQGGDVRHPRRLLDGRHEQEGRPDHERRRDHR